jgi:hypothetical protein
MKYKVACISEGSVRTGHQILQRCQMTVPIQAAGAASWVPDLSSMAGDMLPWDLPAVQMPQERTRIEATVRNLGIAMEDAQPLIEVTEI